MTSGKVDVYRTWSQENNYAMNRLSYSDLVSRKPKPFPHNSNWKRICYGKVLVSGNFISNFK